MTLKEKIHDLIEAYPSQLKDDDCSCGVGYALGQCQHCSNRQNFVYDLLEILEMLP